MNTRDVKELLEFYADAGVDCAVGDGPVDWIAHGQAAKARPAREASRVLPPAVSAPAVSALAPLPSASAPDPGAQHKAAPPANPLLGERVDHQGLADAQALAAAAPTLEALRKSLEQFDGCGLKHTATQLVFSDGNPDAKIMLIGEAPGREEDAQGKPFVGPSGHLLDRMLAAIGLDRRTVYIANVIYWRPPGNRTPSPDERALCEPFVRRQIALVAPKVVMTLGGSALSGLLGLQGIMKTRGRVLTYEHDGLSIPAVPTLHPAALLRNPSHKRLAWQDLLTLQDLIEETGAL